MLKMENQTPLALKAGTMIEHKSILPQLLEPEDEVSKTI